MRPLVVRADASPTIGLGHVMRCLALAQAWRDMGGDVTFVHACTVPGVEDRLRMEGIAARSLAATPGSAADAHATVAHAREGGAALVLDGYDLGADFQGVARRARVPVLAIDDNGECGPHVADLVLNQNLHASEALYRARGAHVRLLLGPRYLLLRRELVALRERAVRPTPALGGRVLVTLGGADPRNVTLEVVRAIAHVAVPGLATTIVVGAANRNDASVAEAASQLANARVLRDVRSMGELMLEHDLAVTAAGSTSWELAFLGVPQASIVLAPNQAEIAHRLATAGVARALGVAGRVDRDELAKAVEEALRDRAWRERSRAAGMDLIDGNGASRVASELAGLRD